MSLPNGANPPRRRVNKAALDEGRDAMNDALRGAVRRSTPESMAFRGTPKQFREEQRDAEREGEALNERAAELGMPGLDQGGRGGGHTPGAHAPERTDPTSAIRSAFRRGRGYED